MVVQCFGLPLRAPRHCQEKQLVKGPQEHQQHAASPGPSYCAEQDDVLIKSLSLASCSMSVVEPPGEQDPLKLNIPFIPVADPLIRPLAPTLSQELPKLYLARTQTSKEEVSLPRHSSSWQVAYLNGKTLSPHSRKLSGQGSIASLDVAADMVLAQLEPLLEAPADAAMPHDTQHSAQPSQNPAAAASPDIGAMCQDWGSMTSPFAHQPSPRVSCLTEAVQSEAWAQDKSHLRAGSSSTASMTAAAEWPSGAHSRPSTSEAIQEADALRTRSDNEDEESDFLVCSSALIQQAHLGAQCFQSSMQSIHKRNSTTQRPPVPAMHSFGGQTAGDGHQAATGALLPGTTANYLSEGRAQRRRTRQITVQPDQENLSSAQAAIPETTACPELTLQKPLESRTNLSKQRAASLQAENCFPCVPQSVRCPAHSDYHPLAPFSSTAMGAQEGENVITREEAYKPQSGQLLMTLPPQPGPTSLSSRKSTTNERARASKSGGAARGGVDTREDQLQHGVKSALDRCMVAAVNMRAHGKQGTAVPPYMQMTESKRAKADVAVRQITARRAAQQAKRRWSY